MATLETTHIFNGAPAKVFRALTTYEKYPEYLPGVTKIEKLPPATKGASCCIRYELTLIKTFFYVLEMFEKEPNSMEWHLVESNIMKTNNGSWELAAEGAEQTKAIYRLDVQFKGFIPSAVTDQVAKANLPQMFAGFQRLIDTLK